MGYVTGSFPNRGLKYPKSEDKPPFQTWAEIERQISRGVTEAEERDLWDRLFLTLPEITDLLAHVKVVARHPYGQVEPARSQRLTTEGGGGGHRFRGTTVP